MSEPLWCEIRRQYCRCHDFGKRCSDYDEDYTYAERMIRREQIERLEGKPEDLGDDTRGNPIKR